MLGLIIRRYHVIIGIVVLFIFGSVVLTSKGDIVCKPFDLPYRVALTFDDGPHVGYTEKILKLLFDKGVKVTFFLVGRQAEKLQNLVKMISLYGHEIGNHSYSHRDLTKLSTMEVISEIEKTTKILEAIINKEVKLVRPPGGNLSQQTQKILKSMGYKIVMWDILSKDLDLNADEKTIHEHIINNLKDGDIVLLHSGRERTLSALPKIIDSLFKKGYRPVTVSEILNRKNQVD